MAVQLGKRYKDEETGIEVLCIKPGDCDLKIGERANGADAAESAAVGGLTLTD